MTAEGDERRAQAGRVHVPAATAPDSLLVIPEIRDYQRINAEVAQRLDGGQRFIRLVGAEGQRLLLAGLSGRWSASIEIEGDAGPELAAGLDAPGVTVVARGRCADGAGSRLRDGRLILQGAAGVALGMAQEGGLILALGGAGPRAGLNQRGGVLIVRGPAGRLAGQGQSGGRIFVEAQGLGPHAGHGRRGGALSLLDAASGSPLGPGSDARDVEVLHAALREAAAWLPARHAAGAVEPGRDRAEA